MSLPLRQIMTAKSALNAVSDEVGPTDLGNTRDVIYFIVGGAGVASGAVQVESAHVKAYAGTWAPEGAAITVTADTVKILRVSGAGFTSRVRISTVLAGGTVDVYVTGADT